MKRLVAGLLLLGAVFLVAGSVWWGSSAEETRQEAEAQRLALRLPRLAGESTIKPWLANRLRQFWPRLAGLDPSGPALSRLLPAIQRRLGGPACEIWLFSPSGAVLRPAGGGPPPGGIVGGKAAEAAFAQARRPWPQGVPGPREDPSLLTAAFGGPEILNPLRGREGMICGLRPLGLCSWGAWREDPGVTDEGKVAGMLVFWHQQRLARKATVLLAVRSCRSRGEPLGYVPWPADAGGILPPGIRRDQVLPVLQDWRRGGAPIQRVGNGLLVMFPDGADGVFLGFVAGFPPRIPSWSWFGLLGLITVGWRWWQADSGRISLSLVLTGLLLVSAGLPLTITLLFWSTFATARQHAVVTEELGDMLEQLVEIDRRFPLETQRRRQIYRTLIRQWGGERLARLQRELDVLERQQLFGFALVIDERGQHHRGFSTLNEELTMTLELPPGKRRARMMDYARRGYPFMQAEFDFAWNWQDPRDGSIPRRHFKRDLAEIDQRIAETAGAIGQDLLLRANAGLSTVERQESPSSLMLGSVVESAAGDTPLRMLAAMGDYYELGSGKRNSRLYLDVLRDPGGRARFFIMIFHDMVIVQVRFLQRLFDGREGTPRDLTLAARSGFVMSQFPDQRTGDRFSHLARRIPSGRGQITELVQVGSGKPRLWAALNGRHVGSYLLIGSRPWNRIGERLAGLARELALAGAAMALLLFILGWRLVRMLVLPTARLLDGVEAMAQRDLDHRVVVGTGDEWDDLAATFNTTLEGMREMAVAQVIQERLLPAGPVSSGGLSFVGRSVMTSSVGGDFFDAHRLPDGSLMFLLGDVSGHGVSAALVVAMIKAGFEGALRAGDTTPAALLDRLSHLLITQVKKTKMMTAVAGKVSPDGPLLLANAGQTWPFLLEPGRPPQILRQASFPLGTVLKRRYIDQTFPFPPGSALVLYSDGVSEGMDPEHDLFGYERLEETVTALADTFRSSRTGTPAAGVLIDGIQQALRRFTREEPWHDDVSIAVLTRDGEGGNLLPKK